MPKGPGRPKTEPKMVMGGNIPRSLYYKVELLLTDPETGEIPYGAKSQLLETLLLDWIAKAQAAHAAGVPIKDLRFAPNPLIYREKGD